jgi:hypothetical protein
MDHGLPTNGRSEFAEPLQPRNGSLRRSAIMSQISESVCFPTFAVVDFYTNFARFYDAINGEN